MMLDILSIWLSNFIKFQNAILFFRNFRKNPLKNVARRYLRNVKQIRPFHISAECRYVFSIFQARSRYVLSLLVLFAHTPFPYQEKFQIRPFHSSATKCGLRENRLYFDMIKLWRVHKYWRNVLNNTFSMDCGASKLLNFLLVHICRL